MEVAIRAKCSNMNAMREITQSDSLEIFNRWITILSVNWYEGYGLPKRVGWQLNNAIESLFN